MSKEVACPQCHKITTMDPSNPYRPFCCERCKLIDLGEWASEGYKIPSEDQTPPDSESEH